MAEYEEEFQNVDAEASLTVPTQAGNLKINGFMVMNGRPCKIVEYSCLKTGKHGATKSIIKGIDVFNGKRHEDTLPSSCNVEVPILRRTEWTVMSVDEDDYLTLVDDKGNARSDLKCPEETDNDQILTQKIKEGLSEGKDLFVTVLNSMQVEKIAELKEH
jgi:translation initiation factor 5A